MPLNKQELMRKARRIEIRSRRRVSMALAGGFQSVFRGTGIEFDSVREYVHGDDVRAVDWNVLARAGRPHVKTFVESRERSFFLVVDRSPSMEMFGSGVQTKGELAQEAAAVIGLVAERNQERVGLIQFTDRVETFFLPGEGPAVTHQLLHDLVSIEPQGRATDVTVALREIQKRVRRGSVVILISDFLDPLNRKVISEMTVRHEVIALRVQDPRESVLDGVGIVECMDPETGRSFFLDAGSSGERKQFRELMRDFADRQADLLRRSGADLIELVTDQDLVFPLLRFFERRERSA